MASSLSVGNATAASAPWPDRIRLPMSFAVEPLAEQVARLDEADWTRHFVPDNYEGRWSVVPLRAGASAKHPILMIAVNPAETEWVDAPFLDAVPAFKPVLAAFRCPITVARLMRLGPGSTIKPHSDPDLSIEQGHARLHIPIATSPDVEFLLNGRRVDMTPGSCWYLRLSDEHEVINRGAGDRIHLVVDALVDGWLLEQLRMGVEA